MWSSSIQSEPGPYILTASSFSWYFVGFFVFGIIERVHNTFITQKDRRPLLECQRGVFLAVFYIYFLIVGLAVFEFIFLKNLINILTSGTGLVVYLCGLILRRCAIRDLGKNWSIETCIVEGQELITNGIFKTFRHPYYIAVLLELSGVCLIANAYFSMFLVILVQLPLLLLRIRGEENMLNEYFNGKYQEYLGRSHGESLKYVF